MVASRKMLENVVDAVGPDTLLDDDSEDLVNVAGTPRRTAGLSWVGRLVPSSQLTPRAKAIRKLRKKLSVETLPDTNLVAISFESPDPHLSQRVVECLIHSYLDHHVRLHRTPGTHEFLSRQKTKMWDELVNR